MEGNGRSQWRRGSSKCSPEGSIDQWSPTRIRIQVKSWIRIRINVMWMRNTDKTSYSAVCESGMVIQGPDFYPSRIQKQQHKRGVKKICCHIFFCSQKFHKIENYFIFEMLK
jgi:hypothetical protein